MTRRVGVLALQGDFAPHLRVLRELGEDPLQVRSPEHLDGIGGLIIPGGESTTMTVLMRRWEFYAPLSELIESGTPVFGTCAGSIMLSDRLESAGEGVEVEPVGGIDVTCRRNAWGRQVESFESEVSMELPGDEAFTVTGVFIRAPRLSDPGDEVEVLGTLSDGEPVCVQQGNLLAATFHSELTPERRLHRYFLSLIG